MDEIVINLQEHHGQDYCQLISVPGRLFEQGGGKVASHTFQKKLIRGEKNFPCKGYPPA